MLTALPPYWFKDTVTVSRLATDPSGAPMTDSGGGVIEIYSTLTPSQNVRFNPKGGGETGAVGRLNTTNNHTIYAPGDADIVAADRILFNGRIFDIQQVSNMDEADVFLKIDAVEVLPSSIDNPILIYESSAAMVTGNAVVNIKPSTFNPTYFQLWISNAWVSATSIGVGGGPTSILITIPGAPVDTTDSFYRVLNGFHSGIYTSTGTVA